MKRTIHGLCLLAITVIVVTASGCMPQISQTAPAAGERPALSIALLPILDALPVYVAQEEGYFQEAGLNVEFIPVGSAAERDQIMAAGKADGMINDLVSVMFYNKEKTQIQVVRFAQVATAASPAYRILASGKSGLTKPEDLKGVDIGISQGSVIEYVTDRLLKEAGFKPGDYKTVAVPKIPDRLALLSTGYLQAATLPEPFSSLAINEGAVVILDDRYFPQYGNSVFSFTKEMIDQNPTAIKSFLQAIDKAIDQVNANLDQWKPVIVKYSLVPDPLVENYKIPPFPTASLPSREQFADVNDWALEEGLITHAVSYAESINDTFLK